MHGTRHADHAGAEDDGAFHEGSPPIVLFFLGGHGDLDLGIEHQGGHQ
jgi:hypothetical protein